MTTTDQAAGLPTTSKALCAVYALIAIAAFVATWSQNAAYLDNPGGFLLEFFNDARVTPAARSLTADILLFFLAHDVRFVWLYIAGGLAIAISVTFPLFLIARELRIGRAEPTRLGTVDTVLLAVLAVGVAVATVWVDMG
jgi:hypothetical protein